MFLTKYYFLFQILLNMINTIFIRCPPTSFHCDNGVCIDGSKRCNTQVDCADGSDEAAPECSAATSTTIEVPVPVPVDVYKRQE